MDRLPYPKVGTIAVTKSGNVFKLLYNPGFIDNLPVDTVLEMLKHECMHVAFNHFTMWDTEPEDENERMIRNAGEDLEINGYLDRSKIAKAAGGLFAEDYGWNKFEGTREYHKKLHEMLDQKQQQAQAQQPQQPCNGGQGGNQGEQGNSRPSQQSQNPKKGTGEDKTDSPDDENQTQGDGNSSGNGGNSPSNSPKDKASEEFRNDIESKSFDDHSMWPKDMTEAEKEILQQTIDELVTFAADEVEKGHGTVPGELEGRIKLLREKKKPKAVADWKRYFRRYVGNEFSEFIRKSKKRESRRFPDAAGNRHRRKSNIIVAIDTSGSVSMPEYQEFFGQIKTLTESTNFHVIECDARIQYEYDFKGKPNETLHGGGGTSFEPPINFYLEHRKDYEGIIYFTDGGAWIPKNTPKECLWVVSSRGDHDRDKYKVNGASVVFIPLKP